MTEARAANRWQSPSVGARRRPVRRHGLRLHILVWALPALAILLGVVLIVDLLAYQWVIVFIVKQRAQEVATASAMRLAGRVQEQIQELTSLADSSAIRFGDTSSRGSALADAMTTTPQLLGDDISFLTRRGLVVASYPRRPSLRTEDLSDSPYFQSLIAGERLYVSDVVRDQWNNRLMVVIAAAVEDFDGQFGGALVTRLYLDSAVLASKVPTLGTQSPGHIYVVDRTGQVVYHPQRELLNQRAPGGEPLARAMVRASSGSETIGIPEGSPHVVGFAAVPGVGWRLVVEEPWEATANPLRTYVWLGSGALLLGVIASIVAILWGARRISTPIDDLVRQAESAVQSDYRTRVRSDSIDELQRLATSFNHMIEQIETHRAGLRQYVAAITRSQEEERRRIARELHDDTIQSLVAINRRLELLQNLLGNGTKAKQAISELQVLVQESVEDVRRFSRELRPTVLEDLGLVPALRQLVKELQSLGIDVSLTAQGEPSDLDPSLELALYRIVQEGINNVRRHAQAHHAQIGLDIGSDLIHLSIEDDGRGFEVEEDLNELAQRGSFGLMGIQERVELLSGEVTIRSTAGEGTRLDVWLPRSEGLSDALLGRAGVWPEDRS